MARGSRVAARRILAIDRLFGRSSTSTDAASTVMHIQSAARESALRLQDVGLQAEVILDAEPGLPITFDSRLGSQRRTLSSAVL